MNKYYAPTIIDENTFEPFRNELLLAQPGDLIIISSLLGGYVDYCLNLANIIVDRQLNTQVDFMCASAGNLIFFAGKNRIAKDYARFLFHQTRYDRYYNTNVTSHSLEVELESLRNNDELTADFISNVTKVDKSIIMNLINENSGEGHWYTAEELLEKGLQFNIISTNETVNLLVASIFTNIKKGGVLMDENLKEPQQENVVKEEPKEAVQLTFEFYDKLSNDIEMLKTQLSELESKLTKQMQITMNQDKQMEELKKSLDTMKRTQNLKSISKLGDVTSPFTSLIERIEEIK